VALRYVHGPSKSKCCRRPLTQRRTRLDDAQIGSRRGLVLSRTKTLSLVGFDPERVGAPKVTRSLRLSPLRFPATRPGPDAGDDSGGDVPSALPSNISREVDRSEGR
jgi:hypothetical protein